MARNSQQVSRSLHKGTHTAKRGIHENSRQQSCQPGNGQIQRRRQRRHFYAISKLQARGETNARFPSCTISSCSGAFQQPVVLQAWKSWLPRAALTCLYSSVVPRSVFNRFSCSFGGLTCRYLPCLPRVCALWRGRGNQGERWDCLVRLFLCLLWKNSFVLEWLCARGFPGVCASTWWCGTEKGLDCRKWFWCDDDCTIDADRDYRASPHMDYFIRRTKRNKEMHTCSQATDWIPTEPL